MAVFSGPEISNDGLVLHLDAANPLSYPGSGTTWFDLSGNNNHGSLINGPSYSTEKKGFFTFDGSNDYVLLGSSETTNIRGSLTVCMIAKSNYTSSSGWNTYWSGVSKYNQFILGPNGVNGKMAFLIYSGTWYPSGYGNSIWGQTNLDPREYHFYTGTYDQASGKLSLYVDGTEEYSSNVGSRTLNDDLASFSIGKRDVSGNFLNSNISNVTIYNRALTESEIKQNFEATRDRYGI